LSPLIPIFLTVLVDVLALTVVLPLLPFYAEQFQASPSVIGVLLASFSVCQLVSGPVLGRLSDRLGRKPVLLVSQLGTFSGLCILASAQSLTWLFVGRMIDGATAGNLSIAQAYIADVTAPEKRTRAFGLVGIAFGIGFLIGPAMAGTVAKHHGNHAPFVLAAALSLASATMTAALLPKVPPRQAPGDARERGLAAARRILSQAAPRQRLLEFFTYLLSFATLTGGLAMFLQRRLSYDVSHVGYVFAYAGLVGGLAQGGIGRLAHALGEDRLSAAGVAAMTGGYVVLGFAYDAAGLAVAMTLASLGAAVVRPSLTTLLTRAVPESDRGLTLGVSQSLASIAQASGPLLGGWLIQRGWLGAWAHAAATFAAATLAVRWLFGKRSV
jgi:MFS family permease